MERKAFETYRIMWLLADIKFPGDLGYLAMKSFIQKISMTKDRSQI